MVDFFVPADNEETMKCFEASRKGTCGPSCIAVVCEVKVAEILSKWIEEKEFPKAKYFIDNSKYRGHSPIKEMLMNLESHGLKIKKQRGLKARMFPHPESGLAIVKIVFLKEDGTEYYWMAEPSHFVVIKKVFDRWWVFSNEVGWITEGCAREDLLKNAFVSSYIEILKGVI